MGPGNSLMRDILWGLESSAAGTQSIRVFGHLGLSNIAPNREKPQAVLLPFQQRPATLPLPETLQATGSSNSQPASSSPHEGTVVTNKPPPAPAPSVQGPYSTSQTAQQFVSDPAISQQLTQVNKDMTAQFSDLTAQQQSMHNQMSELTKMLART